MTIATKLFRLSELVCLTLFFSWFFRLLSHQSTHEKSNIIRYIHHWLPSGKIIFSLKYRWYRAWSFWTYVNTHQKKLQRLASLQMRLEKLHTLPYLRDLILNHIDNYYNNDINNNFPIYITSHLLLVAFRIKRE